MVRQLQSWESHRPRRAMKLFACLPCMFRRLAQTLCWLSTAFVCLLSVSVVVAHDSCATHSNQGQAKPLRFGGESTSASTSISQSGRGGSSLRIVSHNVWSSHTVKKLLWRVTFACSTQSKYSQVSDFWDYLVESSSRKKSVYRAQ